MAFIVANQFIFMKHWTGDFHPESPERVVAIEEALREAQLLDDRTLLLPRQATLEEILLCHTREYVDELKRQINNIKIRGQKFAPFDTSHWHVEHVVGDFNLSPDSFEVALYAAGAPLTAIENILEQGSPTRRAFCITRPPGHHAHRDIGSGFCLFNNVAIAAKHLTQNLDFQRVLIVDWDAHDGDGTQELTQEDPKIFYFSTHKDTSTGFGFYPGPYWGRAEQTGGGTLLNCPVSGSPKVCREGILRAFHEKLIPAMDRYQPQFVLISCGFDAHEKDPLVGLGLQNQDFGELSKICMQIAEKYAQGRIVSLLEGGYNLKAIGDAARMHVEMLNKELSFD